MQWGASTIKCPTLYPCLSLSEIDLKLYIDFEFCAENNSLAFKNILMCRDEQSMMKNNSKKSLHILEDGAKWYANR